MSANCCDNEELAAQVGQDKPAKDGADAYDARHGKYNPKPKPAGSLEQAPSTVSPFGPLKGGS